jgi:site-specific recombinase XerD
MSELKPLSPTDAVEQYLEAISVEKASSTIQTREYQLRHFTRWCDEENITNVNALDGRDMMDYRRWRRQDGDLNNVTLRSQMSNIRHFLNFLGRIDAVNEELHEKVLLPSLNKYENRRDESISVERAQSIIEHLEQFQYASRDHVLFVLLWKTGIRTGGIRAVDIDDYHPRKQSVEIQHRPQTDTPLKNKQSGERMIALNNRECALIDDYLEHKRTEITDEYGREPLLTTAHGRIGKVTIRRTVYRLTRPCVYSDVCPHGKEPNNCEARQNYDSASQCPSSVSAHPIRRGSITHHLDRDVPKTAVSDRMDVSPDIIDAHYDAATKEGKMKRRRKYVEDL